MAEVQIAEKGTAANCSTSQHIRSKSKAFYDSEGTAKSVCRNCGVPMKRTGPGEWEVIANLK